MTANIPIIALLIILEAAYIFISLKAIIREKLSVLRNAFLFGGIIVVNLGSGILMHGSAFRYLSIAFATFGLLKLLYRNKYEIHLYVLFLIMAIDAIKATVEIIIVTNIIGVQNLTIGNALVISLLIMIIPVGLYSFTRYIVDVIDNKWKKEKTFYIRYIMSMCMFAGIFVYLWFLNLYANAL